MKDIHIAEKYIRMSRAARQRGIDFELPLMSLMNICKAKKCAISGVTLSKANRSVDRLDCRKGYVKGNVVATSKAVNQIKGYIENPTDTLTVDALQSIIDVLKKVGDVK